MVVVCMYGDYIRIRDRFHQYIRMEYQYYLKKNQDVKRSMQ